MHLLLNHESFRNILGQKLATSPDLAHGTIGIDSWMWGFEGIQ